jgi:hypothetical protein
MMNHETKSDGGRGRDARPVVRPSHCVLLWYGTVLYRMDNIPYAHLAHCNIALRGPTPTSYYTRQRMAGRRESLFKKVIRRSVQL